MKYKPFKFKKSAQFFLILLSLNFVACKRDTEFEIIKNNKNECLSGSNCEVNPVSVAPEVVAPSKENKSATDKCLKGSACDLTPIATKPGVVTIFLALGDIAQDQLVIAERSAQLIAQNAVKYASPVVNPKILVIKDSNHNGESSSDTEFIAKKLLSAYKADVLIEPASGIQASDLIGYDLVWFNNPGYPMGLLSTFNILKAFKGGVVLSGDDMGAGKGFSTESLTGLKIIDNGSTVSCSGQTYSYDNNSAYQYQVSLEEKFLAGVDPSILKFQYGNDIDDTKLLNDSSKYEVLAYASGAKNTCTFKRPVIVRYLK